MEYRPKSIQLRIVVWALALIGLSLFSFSFNSRFEDREMLLIESLEDIRKIQSDLNQFQVARSMGVVDKPALGRLESHRRIIPLLRKNLLKENFGTKFFNESTDLMISYQQYVHQVKNRAEDTSTLSFRKLNRELDELQEEVYHEVKKVSMDKILWAAGADFLLILVSLLGSIGVVVILKDQIRILINNNKNLAAKLDSQSDQFLGGSWVMDIKKLALELNSDALEVLNLNIFEPKISLSNFIDYFTEESGQELREQIQLCVKEGDSFSVEVQKRNIEGERAWIEIKGTLIREDEQKKILGTVSDIDKTRQLEHRFSTLFDNISQPAFIAGENGLWDCNRATLRFFKLGNKEDFLDKKLPELFPLNQPDGRGSYNTLKANMKKCQREESHRFGWTFRTTLGEIPADVQMFPITKNGTSLFLYILREGDSHISVLKDRQSKVLICDPNAHSLKILRGYFEEEGWSVSTTKKMADALALKEEIFFDMIILDFSIKGLNLELFTLNQEETHLVGMASSGNEGKLNRDHLDSFVSKPIMKEVVLGLIQKASVASERLVVEDVLDLYSGRSETLMTYCNELEIYLDEFEEQFLKSLRFDEWDEMKEQLLTLQSVSKKFSCRGLNQIFDNAFNVLKEKNHILQKDNHKKIVSSFRELIRNLRSKLGNLAA